MTNQTIWGCVNSDGTIYSGTGFIVNKPNTGLYIVYFDNRFADPPAIVLTQNYPDWTDFGNGGNTKDNAVLVACDETKFEAKTGNDDGDAKDRNFAFVAIGTPVSSS